LGVPFVRVAVWDVGEAPAFAVKVRLVGLSIKSETLTFTLIGTDVQVEPLTHSTVTIPVWVPAARPVVFTMRLKLPGAMPLKLFNVIQLPPSWVAGVPAIFAGPPETTMVFCMVWPAGKETVTTFGETAMEATPNTPRPTEMLAVVPPPDMVTVPL